MIDDKLQSMHFESRVESSGIAQEIAPLLKIEFRDFFNLGMQEKSSHIKPLILTLSANMHNQQLSDREFRLLTCSIVRELIAERL